MKISANNNMSFGRIRFSNENVEKKFYQDILDSKLHHKDYRETILDIFDHMKNDNVDIEINPDHIDYRHKRKKDVASVWGQNLFVLLAKTLKYTRSEEEKDLLLKREYSRFNNI